jgi:hypothetical protein
MSKQAQARKQEETETPTQRSPSYLKGFLTDFYDRGDAPRYGYPKNHLPATSDGDMEVTTGYLA